jgi:hypothetical protein
MPRYRIRVRHLVSPFDCTGKPAPATERGWTWCGRLLYHVEPIPKTGPVCKVCERAQQVRGNLSRARP